MKDPDQDSGKTYADMWGEAIHSNRHLRVLSMGLAGLVLLLVVIIIRLSSVELPRPIVVRVDEVGRAEALAYDAVEAQADPLDPTTNTFCTALLMTTTAGARRRWKPPGRARSAFSPRPWRMKRSAWKGRTSPCSPPAPPTTSGKWNG